MSWETLPGAQCLGPVEEDEEVESEEDEEEEDDVAQRRVESSESEEQWWGSGGLTPGFHQVRVQHGTSTLRVLREINTSLVKTGWSTRCVCSTCQTRGNAADS